MERDSDLDPDQHYNVCGFETLGAQDKKVSSHELSGFILITTSSVVQRQRYKHYHAFLYFVLGAVLQYSIITI